MDSSAPGEYAMLTDDALMLLGRRHAEFGAIEVGTIADGRTAAAISVGAGPDSPSMAHKADRRIPNEDALFVRDAGTRSLLIVADAHHGHEASHVIVEGLASALHAIPGDRDELAHRIARANLPRLASRSRTTLTICIVDRASKRCFGAAWGDSSVVTIARDATRRRTMPTADYVGPEDLAHATPRPFDVALDDARLVAAFTDGIDQCHYRQPATSVGPDHIQSVAVAADFDPEQFVGDLASLALLGVDDHPGGQDNLVLAATRV